jgi:lysophospholipase L1-like esterase
MTRIPDSKTSSGNIIVKDEGLLVANLRELNFIGANIQSVLNGTRADVTLKSGPQLSQRFIGNINNVFARHWSGGISAGGVRNDYTSTQCAFVVAPCDEFTQVRFLFKNIEATPPNVTAVCAVTNSSANKIEPSVGNTKTNNPTNGWIDVTFDGDITGTLPDFTSGDVRVAATLWSDWMDLPSIAPTDGASTRPYLMFRTKFSSPFTYWAQGVTRTTIDYNPNFFDQYYRFGADTTGTTENSTAANTNTYQDGTGVFAVEFRSSKRVLKVVCVGDSITQGVGDNTQGNSLGSWVPKSEALRLASGLPVNFLNYGQGACPSVSYLAYGKQAVTDHKPAAAIYSVWTPNDSIPDATNTVTAFNRAMAFANHCYDNNTLPIFAFLAPNDGYILAADNFRKALITRCKATGIDVIDMTPAVGDGASPERFIPAMKNDNTHPNAAGYAAMATINIAKFNEIITRNISL